MLVVFALAAALAPVNAPQIAPVTVVVRGVASGRGRVSLALCPRETWMRACRLSQSVRAARGDLTVRFPAVPPGRYAIMAFHDEDGDNRMGRDALGIPTEGYGFSRDATGRKGPPSFDEAAITVPASGTRLAIQMRY